MEINSAIGYKLSQTDYISNSKMEPNSHDGLKFYRLEM